MDRKHNKQEGFMVRSHDWVFFFNEQQALELAAAFLLQSIQQVLTQGKQERGSWHYSTGCMSGTEVGRRAGAVRRYT